LGGEYGLDCHLPVLVGSLQLVADKFFFLGAMGEVCFVIHGHSPRLVVKVPTKFEEATTMLPQNSLLIQIIEFE
jgi:hypothetical protein